MFIKNIDDVNKKIKTNGILSDYLIRNGNSLLSIKDGFYYYSDTEKVMSDIKNAPVHIKLLGIWEVGV
jgi:hypothetical protein